MEAPVVSLREAAKSANPSNAFYGAVCHSKKGCSGKQCSCRKAGNPCSTKCHSGRSCVNCCDFNPGRELKRIKIDHTDLNSELFTSSPAKSVDSTPPFPAKQFPVYIGSSSPSPPPPPSDWWVNNLLKAEDKEIL